MGNPPASSNPKIDPSKIFVQGDCFYKALAVLCNVEAGEVPRGRHLKELCEQLSLPMRTPIQHPWDSSIAPHWPSEWNIAQKRLGVTIARDPPSALEVGSEIFQRLR
jgi:hypothetical protein